MMFWTEWKTEESKRESKRESKKESKKESKREAVVRMLRSGKLSKEDIAEYAGLTVDAVERIEQQEMSLT